MYARHVSMNLKPNKGDEFTQTLELVDRKESADVYSRETYPQVLKSLAKVVDGTPEVQAYEIVNSSFHKTAAHS